MRWFVQNARNRLLFATRHPGYALRALVRDLTFADERFLAAATGSTALAVRGFLNEPFNAASFADHLRQCSGELSQLQVATADLYAKKVLIQYAVVRALAPRVVVETGVANGVSSAYILLALNRNATGSLHSIEIGDSTLLPPGRGVGWVVPEWLRNRWTLHIGDTKWKLPEVLKDVGDVDIFIHDSLHTYEHMWLEFQLAYPHLKPGSVLLADDALWNSAFAEFANTVRACAARVIRGVGVLRK